MPADSAVWRISWKQSRWTPGSSWTTTAAKLWAPRTALNNQQGSISGVSIDQESANLIQYQQAYAAAAKVVSTIQSLFDTTINMIQ